MHWEKHSLLWSNTGLFTDKNFVVFQATEKYWTVRYIRAFKIIDEHY